jgi:hypothetical protein
MLRLIATDRRFPACAGALLLALLAAPEPLRAAGELPSLSEFLQEQGISAADKDRILAGELVTFTPESTNERELAVGMTFLVKADPGTLVKDYFSKVSLLNPDIMGYGQITGDGTIEQFAKLTLTPNGDAEAKKFLDAKPGSDLNLSKEEIAAFTALTDAGKTSTADVEAQIRTMLLARYQAYKTKGLAGIPPYARGGEDRDVAAELKVATANAKMRR